MWVTWSVVESLTSIHHELEIVIVSIDVLIVYALSQPS